MCKVCIETNIVIWTHLKKMSIHIDVCPKLPESYRIVTWVFCVLKCSTA